jgi:hypothetical protein
VLLADDLGERLRTIFSREDEIGHGAVGGARSHYTRCVRPYNEMLSQICLA